MNTSYSLQDSNRRSGVVPVSGSVRSVRMGRVIVDIGMAIPGSFRPPERRRNGGWSLVELLDCPNQEDSHQDRPTVDARWHCLELAPCAASLRLRKSRCHESRQLTYWGPRMGPRISFFGQGTRAAQASAQAATRQLVIAERDAWDVYMWLRARAALAD